MKEWLKVTLLLCAFGTLREIRPSEPFVSEFLLGEWRNITEVQLNRDVYPVGTYSYLALLVVVFLITDFLRFKPIIILSGISGIIVYAILLWTTSLEWLQVNQFFYGMYMATEVAYLTYIYAKVDSDKYPKVSSYTRMAALIGRFLSGVTAQILVHFSLMDLRELNYITFTAQILATFWAFWLPKVKYGIYFHRKKSFMNSIQFNMNAPAEKQISIEPDVKRPFKEEFVEATTLIARHSRAAYTRPKLIAWSLFYAAALALFVQAQIYMQLLWKEIQMKSENPLMFNGGVEALTTLFGAGGAYLASIFRPGFIVAPVTAVQGLSLFAATYPMNIYSSYIGYTIVGVLFHYTITLASAKIASQLSDESCFGLIFGINTLIGTALQSFLTFILISETVLGLSIPLQYFVMSGLYMCLSVIWFVGWIAVYFRRKRL